MWEMISHYGRQAHEGTVSSVRKLLAKLVSLDFFITLARILLLTPY